MKKIFKRAAAVVSALSVMAAAVAFDMPAKIVAEAALSTSAEGGCDKDHTSMTAWTGGAFSQSGDYYLDGNVTLDNAADGDAQSNQTAIEIDGKDIILCLNGHTISIKENVQARIFYIKGGGSLTLCDCDGNGKLTGGNVTGNGGAVYVYSGSFTMHGGTISGNTATTGGGGVYVNSNGTFNMTGGTISGNTASSSNGGGVYVNGGTFEMSDDSTISNNTAGNDGGGVYVTSDGIFNMTGDSKISGNTATAKGGGVCVRNSGGTFTMTGGTIDGKNTANYGGGVYVNSAGTFIMTGGTISGNTANNGGGVRVASSTFTINGKVDISGNKMGSDANNVYLINRQTITIGNDFDPDSTIGVTTSATPTCKDPIAVTGETSDISSSFTADIDGQSIVYEGGKVQLKGAHSWGAWNDGKRTCSVCGAEEVKCGENAGYTYDEETKTLTITGTGDMYDYDDENPAPWSDVADEIEKVVISEGITSVGGSTFKGCTSLTDVDIPDTVATIGEGAFEGCTSLEEVEIPDSVASIGDNAFKGCTSLTEVTIPDSVTTIGEGAFEGCTSLEEVEIPDSVTSIGDNAFKGCTSLTEVTIPDSVTTIGEGAFEGCTSLEEVEIPDSVTSIGDNAFKDCTSLEEVEFKGTTPPTMGEDVFDGADNLDKITVPEGSENAYKEADGFDGVADNITDGTETPDTPDTPDNPFTPATPVDPVTPDNSDGNNSETSNTSNSETSNTSNSSNSSNTKTEFTQTTEELIDAILSPEERAEIADGDNIRFILQIEDTDPAEDKPIVESVLAQQGELKLGQYIDVSLFKVVNGEKTQITKTYRPIGIKLEVPEDLRGQNRVFSVVRVHDGETTVLPDLDNDPDTVTIETDKFSTYALVYSESASAPDNSGNPSTSVAVSIVPIAAALAFVTAAVIRKKK